MKYSIKANFLSHFFPQMFSKNCNFWAQIYFASSYEVMHVNIPQNWQFLIPTANEVNILHYWFNNTNRIKYYHQSSCWWIIKIITLYFHKLWNFVQICLCLFFSYFYNHHCNTSWHITSQVVLNCIPQIL